MVLAAVAEQLLTCFGSKKENSQERTDRECSQALANDTEKQIDPRLNK